METVEVTSDWPTYGRRLMISADAIDTANAQLEHLWNNIRNKFSKRAVQTLQMYLSLDPDRPDIIQLTFRFRVPPEEADEYDKRLDSFQRLPFRK